MSSFQYMREEEIQLATSTHIADYMSVIVCAMHRINTVKWWAGLTVLALAKAISCCKMFVRSITVLLHIGEQT